MNETELERRLDGWLEGLPEPELPAGFLDRLSLALDAEDRPKRVSFFKPVLAAAACLLLLLGGLSRLSPGAPTTTPAMQAQARFPVLVAAPSPTAENAAPVNLQVGGQLATGPADYNTIEFAGADNRLRLGPNTRMALVSLRGLRAQFQLASGQIRVTEKDAHLSVRTAQANVTPVGHDYEVVASPDNTQILVWEGKVRVDRLRQGDSLTLTAGQRLTVGRHASLPESLGRPRRPAPAPTAPALPPVVVTTPAPKLPQSLYPQRDPSTIPHRQAHPEPVEPTAWQPRPERQREREMRRREMLRRRQLLRQGRPARRPEL